MDKLKTLLQSLTQSQNGRLFLAFVLGGLVVHFTMGTVISTHDTSDKILETTKSSYEEKLKQKQTELDTQKSTYESQIASIQTESNKKQLSLTSKINSLTTQISSLKKTSSLETVEVRYPNGKVEKRTIAHSETDSFNEKIADVKQQYQEHLTQQADKLNQQYQQQISQLQSSHKQEIDTLNTKLSQTQTQLSEIKTTHDATTTNPKNLGLGLGYNTDATYKATAHYTVMGPFFIGADIDTNLRDVYRAGAFIGMDL